MTHLNVVSSVVANLATPPKDKQDLALENFNDFYYELTNNEDSKVEKYAIAVALQDCYNYSGQPGSKLK